MNLTTFGLIVVTPEWIKILITAILSLMTGIAGCPRLLLVVYFLHHTVGAPSFASLKLVWNHISDWQTQRVGIVNRRSLQVRLLPVTTTGDVVEVATSVPAAQSFGHGGGFYTPCEREGWKFVVTVIAVIASIGQCVA
jgi:hypothetical protein